MWRHIGGRHDIVKKLLQLNKIDINQKNKDDLTALDKAIYNGHKDVVEVLLSNGAILQQSWVLNIHDTVAQPQKEALYQLLAAWEQNKNRSSEEFSEPLLPAAESNREDPIFREFWSMIEGNNDQSSNDVPQLFGSGGSPGSDHPSLLITNQ